MHRHTLSETGVDMSMSLRSSRAPSFTSDRNSVASSITFQMPSTVRPAPAYIAASVASQTVTDHHNAQLRREEADLDELQNAVFSEQALALLNAFLDHLLFAFLSSARSPSLSAIRCAISDVLKPRLAREAIEAADEELQGLLAGEEDEEVQAEDGRIFEKWDVEKIWKRTRLRIMVYTRLGELEDEDEEKYVQQERGLSMEEEEDDESGLVSWASAIFLTSVVEFVAEQTLLVSGTAAYARMAARMKRMAQQMEDSEELSIERLVIEEPDVEKIALNAALGRLWRTWRKRASRDTVDESANPLPEHEPTETDIAANIPLPEGYNDVNEIEVPGLAKTFEEDMDSLGTQTPVPRRQRPASVVLLSNGESFTSASNRQRPLSMPMRPVPWLSMPTSGDPEDAELPFDGPLEQTTSAESFESAEETHAAPESSIVEEGAQDSPDPDADMVAFAASTNMGVPMSTVAPIKTDGLEDKEGETDVPSAGGYESEPKVMRSKRMSIERTGFPAVVRTFSTRSSGLRSGAQTPVMAPALSQHVAGTSYLDGESSDEDKQDGHGAIGLARTSDVPIRSTPTPPVEQSPKYGGYVEVQPRQAPTSVPYQSTPMPDPKPAVPDRSVARSETGRTPTSNEVETSPSQHMNATSSPRRQEPQRSASRGLSLPSLQEIESTASVPNDRASADNVPAQSSPTQNGLQRSPPDLDRNNQIQNTSRHVQRISNGDSPRSQSRPHERSPSDKSSLKRVISSSSSGKRIGGVIMPTSGRESVTSHRTKSFSGRMSEEDREREFDSLVRGQDTVKVTLTPQNMRALDDSPLQKPPESGRPSTSSVVIHPRVNAEDSLFGNMSIPKRTASKLRGPIAAQHKPSPSRKVVSRPLAREPRVDTESMRDFADFIRSTGPSPGQEKPVQPFVNISGNGSRAANNNSTSSLGRRASVNANHSSLRSPEGPSARPRVNMEPRSPAGLSTGNDDLIDFIRQGPPNANSGQPRIPRSVAPFRSTVDSDQFETMLGGHSNVESAYAGGSTSSTLNSKQSMNTVNSRTGLIPQPNVVQPAYSNTPQQLSGNMAAISSPVEPQITRTRHRVKDPYAIDVSDEEDEDEDELTALPPSSQPQSQPQPQPRIQPQLAAPRQESLMDFLNGMDPPSTNDPPKPFNLSAETIAAARARAGASSSSSLSSANTTPRNGPQQYGPVSSTSIASDAPRAYKPRLQARAPAIVDVKTATLGRTGTSDLADFLRDSGPPVSVSRSVSNAGKKEDGTKKKKFWQRGRTFGDLP
ncbi:hypothetical protein ACN47E_000047 [Coniothyrium glycines]